MTMYKIVEKRYEIYMIEAESEDDALEAFHSGHVNPVAFGDMEIDSIEMVKS